MKSILFFLFVFLSFTQVKAQESYNQCSNALEICPNTLFSVNNIAATSTVCTSCEDDFNFCFTSENSIWLMFTTNTTGGDVQVDFSNLVFQTNAGQGNELQATIIEASVPCSANSYAAIGNCISNATNNFSLNAIGLLPTTTYYIVIDGNDTGVGVTSPAEVNFDVQLSGTGVLRAAPNLTLEQNSSTICLNETVFFTVHPIDCPNNTDFIWMINGTPVATTTDTLFSTSQLSDGDVVSVETDCYSVCPEKVTVNSTLFSVYSFNVDAGFDLTTQAGILNSINGTTSAPVYSWSPSYLFSDPNSLTTLVSSPQTVTLTLSATENGCTQTDYITLTIDTGLEIPNTFSPNGDGTNEKWIIKGIENYPDCTVRIYTRWGQQVFQSVGYTKEKAWDGSINSRKAAEGVFFYVIDLQNGAELLKGTINLIR